MSKELISVIVPVYKVEQYLDKCISSIVNQTYDNLEIILVDDGSPDNCPKICDNWAEKDQRIKVVHKQNGGLSSARNEGIVVATGKYISFIDSDDYIDSQTYEKMIFSITSTEADMCICGMKWVNEDGSLFQGVQESTVKNEVLEDQDNIFEKLFLKRLDPCSKCLLHCL